MTKFFKYSVKKDDPDALEIAEILIKSGACIDEPDYEGFTPLYWFVYNENIQLVLKLISFEAVRNEFNEIDALFLAARKAVRGSTDIFDFFGSSGIDVNAMDELGHTALHLACESHNTISFLLFNGADVSAEDKDGHTPLRYLDNNHTNYNECVISMVKKFANLSFENKAVFKKDMDYMEEREEVREHFEKFKDELNRMLNIKCHRARSYYSVMNIAKKNVKKLLQLTKKKEFVENYEKNFQQFYYFESKLRKLLDNSIQLENESAIVKSRLSLVLGNIFPDLVLEILSKKLSVKEVLWN